MRFEDALKYYQNGPIIVFISDISLLNGHFVPTQPRAYLPMRASSSSVLVNLESRAFLSPSGGGTRAVGHWVEPPPPNPGALPDRWTP